MPIHEISVNDNKLTHNTLAPVIDQPPTNAEGNAICLVPSLYKPEQKIAILCLDGDSQELTDFFEKISFHILTEVDAASKELPAIGQRLPTADRRRKIANAWKDEKITPEHKHETIKMFLFNSEVTRHGIMITPDSRLVIVDGAGRTSTAIDILSRGINLFELRKINFIVTIDLSGDVIKALKEFLAYNRDAKRTSKGTNVGVETAMYHLQSENGELQVDSYQHPMIVSYLADALYKLPLKNSVLQLLTWRFEGKKSESSDFTGPGTSSSLCTAIQHQIPTFIETKVPPNEMVNALYIGYKNFFYMCTSAVADALAFAADRHHGSKYRFYSTLSVELMTMISARLYPYSGNNHKLFRELVNNVFNTYLMLYREDDFDNKKLKKLTADAFYVNCRYFNNVMFNSGATNAAKVLAHARNALEKVCEKLDEEANNAA